MEGLVEYSFITQPEWISPAVEFTNTGIELNFQRLTSLCGDSQLPSRLCIILEGGHTSTAASEASLETLQQAVDKNPLPPSHKEPTLSAGYINTAVRKLSGERKAESHSSPLAVVARQRQPVVARQRQAVKRTESVIAREIRLQKEREDDVRIERQRAMRQQRRNELRRVRTGSGDSSSKSCFSSDDCCEPPLPVNGSSFDDSFKVSGVSVDIRLQPLTDNISIQSMDSIDTQTQKSKSTSSSSAVAVAYDGVTSAGGLLTTMQRKIIDEKIRQSLVTSKAMKEPLERSKNRKIFHLSDQLGPITNIDETTSTGSNCFAPDKETRRIVRADDATMAGDFTQTPQSRELRDKTTRNSTIKSPRGRSLDAGALVVTV